MWIILGAIAFFIIASACLVLAASMLSSEISQQGRSDERLAEIRRREEQRDWR